jgi:vitamin B12/bleomycin/antimicrobial peptide transport system ATP-binding/permease protein
MTGRVKVEGSPYTSFQKRHHCSNERVNDSDNEGRHSRPPRTFCALVLSQRTYFPIGILSQAGAYPGNASGLADQEIRAALSTVGLERFVCRLDEEQAREQQLCGGEQQLVGTARALLQRPAWLFTDEATSAIDEANQARIYKLVQEILP